MSRMTRKMYQLTIDQLSLPLKKPFVVYEEGKAAQEALEDYAKRNYMPFHSKERYVNFVKKHMRYLTIKTIHPQETNIPYVFVLFTEASHHVYGNCLEECIDNAIAEIKKRNK